MIFFFFFFFFFQLLHVYRQLSSACASCVFRRANTSLRACSLFCATAGASLSSLVLGGGEDAVVGEHVGLVSIATSADDEDVKRFAAPASAAAKPVWTGRVEAGSMGRSRGVHGWRLFCG
mmetsp:Transcript_13246/g.40014  ORF Transcript_13246/g.40014 Transcript_13246/m.40014 type:complete len:120 (+) Transcript_13246:348-707(+)